jgi:hypothetical protein
MFIGHNAIAFAAKRLTPHTSLGTLFFAVQFLDLLWPVLLLVGIEHVRIVPGITAFSPLDLYDFPYSHSLLFAAIWSVLFGIAYAVIRRNGRGGWVVGGCVFSHWILDAIAHRPDMPLYPGNATRVGLGLWDSIAGTLAVELTMFAVGLLIYVRSTSAKGIAGHVSLWSLIVMLIVLYAGSVGNPPPDERTIALVGFSAWLIVAWGYWIDRTITTRAQ